MTDEERQKACQKVLAQSDARLDAVVTTCPKCGKPVTSYWHKDNSGCESRPEYALIADAVFHAECLPYAQSDAEPPPKHPIGFDDKPMMDWYYDDEGVCRPSRAGRQER